MGPVRLNDGPSLTIQSHVAIANYGIAISAGSSQMDWFIAKGVSVPSTRPHNYAVPASAFSTGPAIGGGARIILEIRYTTRPLQSQLSAGIDAAAGVATFCSLVWTKPSAISPMDQVMLQFKHDARHGMAFTLLHNGVRLDSHSLAIEYAFVKDV